MRSYLDAYLIFTAFAFWGIVIWDNLAPAVYRWLLRRKRKIVSSISNEIDGKEDASNKSTAELSYRDISGKLVTVKITVDYALDGGIAPEIVRSLLDRGGIGMLASVLGGDSEIAKKMRDATEFVFSHRTVSQIKACGMELEDFVAKILKATGRMP